MTIVKGRNCPSCAYSIPLGEERLGCFITKQLVDGDTKTCSHWTEFKSVSNTRKLIGDYKAIKKLKEELK